MISNLDGQYKAIGEELTRLGGRIETRLISTLTAVAVSANVESTIDWPAAGVLYMEGERIPYTSKTATSFHGLVRDPQQAVAHRPGVAVADGSRSYSQVDQARADRLVLRATGTALDRLSWGYGERRPVVLTDDQYRAFLRVVLYLERGLWWSLYRALQAALVPWIRTGIAHTAGGTPHRLTAAGGAGTFTALDVGRPLEVNGRVYRVREVDPAGAFLDLQPGRGPWFCAGNFGDGTDVTWSIPPFRIMVLPDTDPSYVLLDFFLPSGVLPPPSYSLNRDPMFPIFPEITPVGWPIGSQTLDDYTLAGAPYHPWYLPGLGENDAFSSLIDDLLPAGISPKFSFLVTP